MQVHNPNNLPTLPIADLLPTQGNLKDLSEKNYAKLKNTIERRGFSYPVYVWESPDKLLHLLDGHQRQRVLTTEGWNEPIPYLKVPAKDLQEAMARLLEITSQYATITQEGIDEFIGKYDLNEAEVYEATSFDALAFDKTVEEPEVEEDEAPEVDEQGEPESRLGEIYQLGRHRVMCGDSTDKDSVELLMDGQKADAVLSDPPYGMDLDTDFSNMTSDNSFASGKKHSKVIGDSEQFDATYISGLAKEVILFGADYYVDTLPNFGKEGSWMVWDKRSSESQDKGFGSNFETIWSKTRHKRWILRHEWFGFFTGGEKREYEHPTTKPVKLLADILTKVKLGNNIVDLFLGSGSTLIACEQTDRTCYGMELDPKYVDVIRKRYAKLINNHWEEDWETLTPAISGEKQVEDAIS